MIVIMEGMCDSFLLYINVLMRSVRSDEIMCATRASGPMYREVK